MRGGLKPLCTIALDSKWFGNGDFEKSRQENGNLVVNFDILELSRNLFEIDLELI
jgi:hypothetical protein